MLTKFLWDKINGTKQGLFQKLKAASGRDMKGHYSTKKTMKGHLRFEQAVGSQHIYTAFDKINF